MTSLSTDKLRLMKVVFRQTQLDDAELQRLVDDLWWEVTKELRKREFITSFTIEGEER